MKKDGIKSGLSDRQPIGQDKPRGETDEKTMRPTKSGESVKSDRGSFTVK